MKKCTMMGFLDKKKHERSEFYETLGLCGIGLSTIALCIANHIRDKNTDWYEGLDDRANKFMIDTHECLKGAVEKK